MIGGRMEKEYIEKRLINKIGKKRWAHSLRVLKEAEKLANLYGADLKQVYLAALLHDCGKLQDKDELLKRAKHFGIILDDIRMNNLELIHAPLGAKIAEKRSEEHTSELQSRGHLVCRLLLEKENNSTE